MTRFKVEETVACYVTWRCYIEADNEEQAYDLFCNGERGAGEEEGPFIGDSIEFCPPTINVSPAEPVAITATEGEPTT